MSRPVRYVGVLTALLLLPLSGCGESSIESYCGEVREHRRQLAEMVSSEQGPEALLDGLPLLRDLAEEAPDDISDEWQTFLNAVENLDSALDDAGVSPEEFEGGRPPEELSQAEREAVADAASGLTTDEVAGAAGGIEQQARDVCKVNFGL
jgi:hypothetical protein